MPNLNKSKILGSILFSSLFLSFTWISSFYISSKNVDFFKYYSYINYFTGLDVKIDYGQGVIYYFLIAKRLLSRVEDISYQNYEMILNVSIQEVNFIFFLFGLLGFFYLLKFRNFKTETILVCFVLLIFLPQSIYLRAVMKPEIIAFAFTPWVLVNLEKYLLDKKLKNLFLLLPFLALILNSKGSIAGMLLVYLFIAYFEILKKISLKNFIIVFISLILIISLVQFENYSITGTSLLDRPYDIEYDQKAEPKILFKVNLLEAARNPFFKLDETGETYHNDSVVNTILLDSFGDYFNQLFDNDEQKYFSDYRKILFVNNSEYSFFETRQINYKGKFSEILMNKMDHIRKLVSLIYSLIFYGGLLFLFYKDKENRRFYVAPFIGIFVLYVNSLGFPSNNFNIIKGDTFKAFYFSFLLTIAVLFLGMKLFNKIDLTRVVLLVFLVCSFIFITGHPKENSQELSEHLIISNQYSPMCTINNLLIYENNLVKSLFRTGNIDDLKISCSEKNINKRGFSNRWEYDEKHKDNCIDSNNVILSKRNSDNLQVSSSSECRIYALEQVKHNNNLVTPKTPYISIFILLSCLFITLYETRNFTKK